MLNVGAFDSFDMMALSYFHTALYGDGTRLTVAAERRERSSEASEEVIPLFEAIERSRRQTNAARAGGDDLLQLASTEDAHALMQRFTSRLFTDALNRAKEHDAAAAEQLGDLPENLCYLGAQKHEYIRELKYLITHENLHSASMTDVDGAGELVRHIVRRDRVPKRDLYEGLLLLREAWDEYDVCMFLAGRYKLRSKACQAEMGTRSIRSLVPLLGVMDVLIDSVPENSPMRLMFLWIQPLKYAVLYMSPEAGNTYM